MPAPFTRVLLAALLAVPGISHAQAPPPAGLVGADGKPLKTVAIALDDLPGRKGEKARLFQGVADPAGSFYLSQGNYVRTPIVISVMTKRPEDAVTLKVFKNDLGSPLRELRSQGRGYLVAEFRTQDSYLLQLSAPRATPFQMLVWNGPALKPQLKSPFVPTAKSQIKGKGAKK